MCHECKKKVTFSLAMILATGAIGFLPDDNNPEDNRHDAQSVPDMARLLQIEMMRSVPKDQQTPEAAATIAEALIKLREEIGGARFAYATMQLVFMHEAMYDAARLSAELIAQMANRGSPADHLWMQRYGSRVGYAGGTDDVEAPPGTPPEVVEVLRRIKAGLPPGSQVEVLTPLGAPRAAKDKPVGTGPNGEVH